MELVGAHREALSAIDSIGTTVDQEQSNSSEKNTIGNESSNTDDILVSKEHLVQEEEREKGRVGFSVYRKYIIMAYGGALVPFIVLALSKYFKSEALTGWLGHLLSWLLIQLLLRVLH